MRLPIVRIVAAICLLLLLPISTIATSRGITIQARTPSGDTKEIQLYSGYHALVVGISEYDSWPDLPNATKDAQEVAEVLKGMGFSVTTVLNPSSQKLRQALNEMTDKYANRFQYPAC